MRRVLSITALVVLSVAGVFLLGGSNGNGWLNLAPWSLPASAILPMSGVPAYANVAGEYRTEVPASEAAVGAIGEWYLHLTQIDAFGRYRLHSGGFRVDRAGYFTINSDQIIFYDDHCVAGVDQLPSPGIYTWKFIGSGLTLELVRDTCLTTRSDELIDRVWVRELYRVVK